MVSDQRPGIFAKFIRRSRKFVSLISGVRSHTASPKRGPSETSTKTSSSLLNVALGAGGDAARSGWNIGTAKTVDQAHIKQDLAGVLLGGGNVRSREAGQDHLGNELVDRFVVLLPERDVAGPVGGR